MYIITRTCQVFFKSDWRFIFLRRFLLSKRRKESREHFLSACFFWMALNSSICQHSTVLPAVPPVSKRAMLHSPRCPWYLPDRFSACNFGSRLPYHQWNVCSLLIPGYPNDQCCIIPGQGGKLFHLRFKRFLRFHEQVNQVRQLIFLHKSLLTSSSSTA